MLSLQDGVKQIYSENPGKLYFLTGPEYGVKKQYLDVLANHYNQNVEVYESLANIISVFQKKSLIPRPQSLYVVRYDFEFSSKPSENILKLNIPGTIVAIYDDDKSESKLDKVFPNNVLRINKLTSNVMLKHLSKQFADLSEIHIKAAIKLSTDFYSAQTICRNMLLLPSSTLHNMSQKQLEELFGYESSYDSDRFKQNVANRDFKLVVKDIESYEGELSLLLYDMLSTYLEIIKVIEKPYSESIISAYVKKWDFKSAKNMFIETYKQLEKLRNYSTYSPYVSLIYLASLLKYKLG